MSISVATKRPLPSLPSVAAKLLAMVPNPDVSVRDIGEVIRLDPSTASKVLRAANSAQYGIGRPVAEVDRAIVLLGKRTVSTLALTFSLSDAVTGEKRLVKFFQRYWMESVVQALTAEFLAEKLCAEKRSEFFCSAILQDLGRLFFLQNYSDDYASVIDLCDDGNMTLIDAEKQAFDMTHVEVTCGMLTEWRFPQQTILAVAAHHEIGETSDVRAPEMTLDMALKVAALVGQYFCSGERGMCHIKLEEILGCCPEGTPPADELLDAVHQRLGSMADLFRIDATLLASPTEMMGDAMHQVAALAISLNDGSSSESVSVELMRENNRLRKRLEEVLLRTQTDQLTGVFVRAVLFDRLERQIEQAVSRNNCMGLLFADVDNFKLLNDTYGHLAGDHVLRKIAQTIAAKVRGNDIVGRYGGEEFAILVPDADLQTLNTVAERVRKAVEDLKFECGGEKVTVTISVGAALIGPLTSEEGVKDLAINTADAAMYRAKHDGRNRVVVIAGAEVPGCKLIRTSKLDLNEGEAINLPQTVAIEV